MTRTTPELKANHRMGITYGALLLEKYEKSESDRDKIHFLLLDSPFILWINLFLTSLLLNFNSGCVTSTNSQYIRHNMTHLRSNGR